MPKRNLMHYIPSHILARLQQAQPTQTTTIYSKAPGRINLIGEHTDYNNGLVLPGAIDKYMYFSVTPNGRKTTRISALDIDRKIEVDLEALGPTGHLWADYLVGIVIEFQKKQANLMGFDAAFTSEIPIGAGMSSSAALDCAFITALSELFKIELDNWEKVFLSQRSNNGFLGIKSGILDQFASIYGQKQKVMFLDCDNQQFSYVPLVQSDYTWLLIDTCVKHTHLESGYNDRVTECRAAVHDINKIYPRIKHLSQIGTNEKLDQVTFSSEVYEKRAKFVVGENSRVRQFVNALKNKDLSLCGELLYQSHDGLSKDYEVSCPELDFLVDKTSQYDSVLGARMMGGGFGGCTINLVHKEAIEDLKTDLTEKYLAEYHQKPAYYEIVISDGAQVVKL